MEASITLKSLAKKYNNDIILADLSLGIESNSNHMNEITTNVLAREQTSSILRATFWWRPAILVVGRNRSPPYGEPLWLTVF